MNEEILVVASKVKKYIKEAHGLNTSSAALPVLSAEVKRVCDQAAERAKGEKRKTLLDRDIQD